MFIKDNKKQFYDVISSARKRVLVFVGHDIDGMCATKLIQHLFECDHIQYTIIPINTLDDLLRSYKEHFDRIHFILLINIGITIDIIELLNPEKHVKIFIADSHRPIDVYNVYRDQQVSIISTSLSANDDEEDIASIPTYEELFKDSDDEEDSSDETDARTLSLEQLEKRKERHKWEQNRKRLLFEYTQFSYHSYSTALTFFDLCWKLSKDNNELLWLAIIGVSDQFINGKIGEHLHDRQCRYLKDAMTRLRNIRGNGTALATIVNNNDNVNCVTINNHLAVSYETDLQITLYRHWSIYESLRHSMYVSCKFKIWKLRGHKRMLSFLAELGLPLSQCKQKFSAMDLELRTNVKEWINKLCDKYGLTQLMGHSFIASRGYKHKYNSCDVSLAVRALLESTDKDKRDNQKFFDALDSLSWNNIEILESGFELAKSQLKAIMKQVHMIIDSKQINLMNGQFWYVIIDESTPDATLFSHTSCLKALARYLLHANAASNPKSQKCFQLPLVLITPKRDSSDSTSMAMAVGIPPLAVSSPRNFFSKAFSQVSQRLKECEIEHNLVDLCVVQLVYNERMNFLNELSLLLS